MAMNDGGIFAKSSSGRISVICRIPSVIIDGADCMVLAVQARESNPGLSMRANNNH